MKTQITDCHFHVFGPTDRFPTVGAAAYVPEIVTLAQHDALFVPRGTTRQVIVAASCYGTDNRCHMEALAQMGPAGRAVVQIDAHTPAAELAAMTKLGARGARFNAISPGALGFDVLYGIVDRIRGQGWHAEIYARRDDLAAQVDRLLATGLDIVVAHYGDLDPALGLRQPAVAALDRLLASGRGWLKLSAPYRVSQAPGYTDLAPYARHFIGLRPDRLLWGSDWPYIGYAAVLREWDPMQPLAAWVRDPAVAELVYWTNPARLYGFPP